MNPDALLAEEVLLRDADVVEGQLRGVLGVLADLVQVAAALEALHAALDHEQRDALVAGLGVGARDDDDQVGQDAVGDERLGPVEDVVVALVDRGGADALEVGARARLGHRDRRDLRAADEVREPALLLLVVRAGDEVRHDHVVEQREGRAVDAAPGHLLADHHVVAEVGRAPAAVLLVELESEQALRARLGPHVAVDDPVLLPLVVVGDDLLVEERADRVAEGLVLLVEDLARHRSPPGSGAAHRDSKTVRKKGYVASDDVTALL